MAKNEKTARSAAGRASAWFHALMAQPPGGFYARPELHIVCGGMLQLDGCRRLTRFDEDAIGIEAAGWLITLYGDRLRIESLCGKRLLISGSLQRAEFSRTVKEKGGGHAHENSCP